MTDTLTHALTIHQPYAWAISAGHKPVENRTWRPPLEAVGKLIGIHAGKGWAVLTEAEHEALGKAGRIGVIQALNTGHQVGALIGVARLVGVVKRIPDDCRESFDPEFFSTMGRGGAISFPLPPETCARIRPWWRGPWGWLLDEAVLLPEPIPMRGQQGLWRITGGTTDGNGMNAAWALEQWRKARETR